MVSHGPDTTGFRFADAGRDKPGRGEQDRTMRAITISTGLTAIVVAGQAWAQETLPTIGKPVDGATGFQPAATELASDIHWLDGMITYIITAIVIFVLALLAIVILRYNSKMNPTPARFTHNTPVEVAWTIIPVIILVFIGAFSLPVLFKQQEIPKGDIVIKVTGSQWYWHYDYVDDGFGFDSNLIGNNVTVSSEDEKNGTLPFQRSPGMDEKLKAAGYSPDDFLLAVDNPVVLPVGKVIVMQVTGADVIHSWTIPAFGVKQDAVPGRIAELWFKPEKEGIYFGQCSELCGPYHAYMPITVKVVSEQAYADWLAKAKQQFAAADVPAAVQVASK
jgi:cytochrome c oxidase subunit 2